MMQNERLVQLYRDTDNTELEIRFRIQKKRII